MTRVFEAVAVLKDDGDWDNAGGRGLFFLRGPPPQRTS